MTKANDSGQASLEIAFALSFFMVLVMATVDFGNLYSTKLTLQNAVRQAGRYAITGQCINSGGACTQSRYNSIVSTLQDTSVGLLTTTNTSYVTISCTNEGGGCPNNAGGPGDVVTISVSYPYTFITPLIGAFFPRSSYTISVSASFTNEPFPPSQS